MSYQKVIAHIEQVLNKLDSPARFIIIGKPINIGKNRVYEIEDVLIKKQIGNFSVKPPEPFNPKDADDTFLVNRIRVSDTLADDYSHKWVLTDEEMLDLICGSNELFGYCK